MGKTVKHKHFGEKPKLSYITGSVKGIQRERNQDRAYVLDGPGYHLFIIFDGVSSYPESYRYIETFMEFLDEHHHEWLDNEKEGLGQLLYLAYLHCRKTSIAGSTTISALFIPDEKQLPKMVSIGDSRVYAFRRKNIVSLAEDDNVPEMPNILTRWVGHDYLLAEDFRPVEVALDNQFLLCSDGFYGVMEENREAFYRALKLPELEGIKEELYRLMEGKNSDDASYILVRRG
ncbi:PP2C family serine/threonine-protein phosphatase [Prolixibacter sp. SD074]|uniref:PP2C family protein-serine/threonine phosphatase n=1 Tax=Prolixibacter sp. SD074 TaxID=2652391 RepID=UPI001284EBD3|nr:protein phosphatase 2C domain-containing protein [Prolixibacter sp. SD074]GET29637.1 protein phosphatase [Prolixibacter sp. SD074]